MDLGIKGRVAIVTGGSRGLGRQAALSLAGEGVNVVICARGDDKLKETVEELRAAGSEADGVVADCSIVGDRERLFSSAVDRFGQVDIVVNNVGGLGGGGFGVADTGEEELMPGASVSISSAPSI